MSTKIEYLNPADWSLHVVDVDNDAAGEDWIKVPDGAIKLLYSSMNNNHYHFVNGCGQLMALYDVKANNEYWYGDAYSYESIASVVWSRYTQPEELPFVDDEPKGKKHDSAKPRMSLLPKGVLSSVVSVLEFGAKKYQEDNWKQVSNAKTRYYDAMQRHIGAWWEGEKNDPETGEHHLAHAICCAMFLIWFDKEQSQ